MDSFNVFLIGAAAFFWLLNILIWAFIPSLILWLLQVACIAWAIFRAMSRNINMRALENRRYNNFSRPIKMWFKLQIKKFRERKEYKYCKCPTCKEIAKDAPLGLDHLCEECAAHFEGLKKRLDALQIDYTVNPRIVRGLDYYTRTVFEFISGDIGAQSTVCGGGRYDGLLKSLGGPDQPGIGYAMGVERLLMVLEAQGIDLPDADPCELYVAGLGEKAQQAAFALVQNARKEGFSAECDLVGRSLKAQMKYANKIGAKYVLVLGDSELESGVAKLKTMEDGSQNDVELSKLIERLYDLRFAGMADELGESGAFGKTLFEMLGNADGASENE
jgi:histidyl-tRNA synthetase